MWDVWLLGRTVRCIVCWTPAEMVPSSLLITHLRNAQLQQPTAVCVTLTHMQDVHQLFAYFSIYVPFKYSELTSFSVKVRVLYCHIIWNEHIVSTILSGGVGGVDCVAETGTTGSVIINVIVICNLYVRKRHLFHEVSATKQNSLTFAWCYRLSKRNLRRFQFAVLRQISAEFAFTSSLLHVDKRHSNIPYSTFLLSSLNHRGGESNAILYSSKSNYLYSAQDFL